MLQQKEDRLLQVIADGGAMLMSMVRCQKRTVCGWLGKFSIFRLHMTLDNKQGKAKLWIRGGLLYFIQAFTYLILLCVRYPCKSYPHLERHGISVTLLGSLGAVNCLGLQL